MRMPCFRVTSVQCGSYSRLHLQCMSLDLSSFYSAAGARAAACRHTRLTTVDSRHSRGRQESWQEHGQEFAGKVDGAVFELGHDAERAASTVCPLRPGEDPVW